MTRLKQSHFTSPSLCFRACQVKAVVSVTPELTARLPLHDAEVGRQLTALLWPPPQAAAEAGPPAAAVRGETAALPDPAVGAADLRGTSWQLQAGAERYELPRLPDPTSSLPLLRIPVVFFTLGV